MRISQPRNEKKNVGNGPRFQRVILAETFEWRGTLALCDSVVPPSPIGPSCRGTQIILISSNLWNASLWEFCCFFFFFLQPNYEKVLERAVLKFPFHNGAPIQRAILGGALEWKGTLRVPPQPGCPRVCPPWAHRSYATVQGGPVKLDSMWQHRLTRPLHVQHTYYCKIYKQNPFNIISRGVQRWTSTDFRLK